MITVELIDPLGLLTVALEEPAEEPAPTAGFFTGSGDPLVTGSGEAIAPGT